MHFTSLGPFLSVVAARRALTRYDGCANLELGLQEVLLSHPPPGFVALPPNVPTKATTVMENQAIHP